MTNEIISCEINSNIADGKQRIPQLPLFSLLGTGGVYPAIHANGSFLAVGQFQDLRDTSNLIKSKLRRESYEITFYQEAKKVSWNCCDVSIDRGLQKSITKGRREMNIVQTTGTIIAGIYFITLVVLLVQHRKEAKTYLLMDLLYYCEQRNKQNQSKNQPKNNFCNIPAFTNHCLVVFISKNLSEDDKQTYHKYYQSNFEKIPNPDYPAPEVNSNQKYNCTGNHAPDKLTQSLIHSTDSTTEEKQLTIVMHKVNK